MHLPYGHFCKACRIENCHRMHTRHKHTLVPTAPRLKIQTQHTSHVLHKHITYSKAQHTLSSAATQQTFPDSHTGTTRHKNKRAYIHKVHTKSHQYALLATLAPRSHAWICGVTEKLAGGPQLWFTQINLKNSLAKEQNIFQPPLQLSM